MSIFDQNALDHYGSIITFIMSEDAETVDKVVRGTEEGVERTYTVVVNLCCKLNDVLFVAHVKRWLHDGKGLMAYKSVSVIFICALFSETSWNSGCDTGIKMRLTNEELLSLFPEFDCRWSTYFVNAPDKPVLLVLPFARRALHSIPY